MRVLQGLGYSGGLCTHFMVCCSLDVPAVSQEAQKDSGEVMFYHRLSPCYRRSAVAMQHTGPDKTDRKMCVQELAGFTETLHGAVYLVDQRTLLSETRLEASQRSP